MVKRGAVAALGLALGFTVLVSPSAAARGAPTVELATMNGSGCPAGSVKVEAMEDGFVVRYGEYAARVGGDSRPTDARRNCQLSLKVGLPEGVTYALDESVHRGSAHLEPGAKGLLRAQHYYAGSPAPPELRHEYRGPFSDGWVIERKLDSDRLIWVSCGEKWNLNLSTELRLSTSDTSKTSVMDMNSGVGSAYHFRWRACP